MKLFDGKYRMLQKMKYFSDQEGIIHRFHRERENWIYHLDHTKSFIIESTKNSRFETLAVLGSGWLLDLPMDHLLDVSKEVWLYDINHPAQVVHKYRKNHSIKFIREDLTGNMIHFIYHTIRQNNKEKINIHAINPCHQFSYKQCDYVISLNILNQLDIILIDYMKYFSSYQEPELNELRKKIQFNHISSLPKNQSCLISDFEEISIDTRNQTKSIKPLIFTELPNSMVSREWEWIFDTTGSYIPHCITTMRVKAIKF